MAKLTEQTVIDKIEIVGPYRAVQVRTARVIYDGDQEISRSFSRHVVSAGGDTSNETAEVQAVCKAVHTPEVNSAYAAMVDAQEI
jgi:hypothetical protein